MLDIKGRRPVVKIFIGRMSPFHKGHEAVLTRALLSSDLTLVLLGSANLAVNSKNPFSYPRRETMIRCWLNEPENRTRFENKLFVLPLRDHPSDTKWADAVRHAVYGAIRSLSFSSRMTDEEI